jgi:hypothetical protein
MPGENRDGNDTPSRNSRHGCRRHFIATQCAAKIGRRLQFADWKQSRFTSKQRCREEPLSPIVDSSSAFDDDRSSHQT